MENRLVFSLGELVRDIDVLARFKKHFGFDEHQATLTDLKEYAKNVGLEANGDSKAFMSTDQTTMLVTNYKKLNLKKYVAFNLRILKKVLDILNDSKDEEITVFVNLEKEMPCIVTNSTTAIIVAPRVGEDLPENVEEAETEVETETQETQTQETETQEEQEPVPATA